ncbi:MAG: hypothetical protein ACE5GM_02770 [bacterium]
MTDSCSDLVVLVADKNMEAAIQGVLSRPEALGIKPVQATVYVHPHRDPGCFLRGSEFLRPMVNRYSYGLLMFDRVGSGKEDKYSKEKLESIAGEKLSQSGWGDRSAVVVLDPELEIWVWSDSPEVEHCLGWKRQKLPLRQWLNNQGIWSNDRIKPEDPKAAIEKALHKVRKPRSSAIYKLLADRVGFSHCTDPAFEKLKNTLSKWFPVQGKMS